MAEKTSNDIVNTVLESLEKNTSSLIGLTSMAAPQMAVAVFGATAVLKFIQMGRKIEKLKTEAQNDYAEEVRKVITPTLLTSPDPEIESQRDMEMFFILDGRVNPELKSQRFVEVYEALKDQLDIFIKGDTTDKQWRRAIKDLAFAFHHLVPAHERGRFGNPIFQDTYGHMLLSAEGYRTILVSVRESKLTEYQHTPDWYSENLSDYFYWQMVYRFSESLLDEAKTNIESLLSKKIRETIVQTIFGDDGLFSKTVGTVKGYRDKKLQVALDKILQKEMELKRAKEDLDEEHRETLNDYQSKIQKLAWQIEDAETEEEMKALQDEKRGLERKKTLLENEIVQKKGEMDRKLIELGREKEDLQKD
jgi:hypothetical protein